MSDNFQQTVDLKPKKEEPKRKSVQQKSKQEKTEEIDEVFNDRNKKDNKADLQKIEKFKEKQVNEGVLKRTVIILGIIIVFTILYFMVFDKTQENEKPTLNWYAVKLITGEIYYGQINDIKADPVMIDNVYYNYDQLKEGGGIDTTYKPNETGNIRLVKRGKETHGPAGSLNVVRAQVVYMEPLKEDSNVLKAIINYEK